MNSEDERCIALAARQAGAYEAMRRQGRHLFAPIDNQGLPRGEGKQYIPIGTKPQPIIVHESKVLTLRRKPK